MKKTLIMLTLLLVASSSFAMKKADFIKSGLVILSETETQLTMQAPDGSIVIAIALKTQSKKGKDGKDYFVLK